MENGLRLKHHKPLTYLARPAGIEPATPWFVAKYSIHLSYGRMKRNYSKLAEGGIARYSLTRIPRPSATASEPPCRRPARPVVAGRTLEVSVYPLV